MTLSDYKKIHMVGIKGTGMSALAFVLHDQGIKVSGSDSRDSFLLLEEKLYTNKGIKISSDFASANLPNQTDLIIAQPSHNNTKNPEIKEAGKRKIPIISYAQAVAKLIKEIPTIAIAGSHGKTTTTNLLSYILRKNKVASLALSGPTSKQVINTKITTPARLFVAETDEYENKLRLYSPESLILTNVEYDHPDFYKTPQQYKNAFSQYVKKLPKDGFLIYWADDSTTRSISKTSEARKISYGFSKSADYRIELLPPSRGWMRFEIRQNRQLIGTFRTHLLGKHNILNTTASILASREMGLNNKQIQQALSSFKGSPRRLEKVSSSPLIYDDYGHHPTEIEATLQALRKAYPKKEIWTIFQAHTFTRTKKFLKEFGRAFKDSDHVIVLNIWGSAREKKGTIHAYDITHEMALNKTDAYHIPTIEKVAKFMKKNIKRNTLILTLGASDIWKIHALLK